MGDVDADDVDDDQSAGFDGFDLGNDPELQRLLDLLASHPERRTLSARLLGELPSDDDDNDEPDSDDEAYRDGGFGGVPASATAIAELERQECIITNVSSTRKRKRGHRTGGVDDDEEDAAVCECPVCLEEFTSGDDLIVMPCKHRFHERCMVKWLGISRLCPCCRHALPSSEGKAEQVSISTAATPPPARTLLRGTTANRRYRGRAAV
ncbi:hypothetical protein PR202_gb16424 [Eleusine coracana subsp. coracana]|uniref:RING-type domain-containing protein n=1 Tax=Eleusine coracana subsp. coracana TaxID=191504 RepID=A0AAV5F1G1_ELECO|nr:hypothetical protein PR202_gb16424 [Eleusine coracana subsp. coracana]